jgi:RNA recognition motif-containing protein
MSVRLFVGNLPYDATEEEIREHFSTAGSVLNVFLPVDRETGRKRGFAFVEFHDSAAAAEAIRLFNSQPFKGRALAVNEARAKESRPASASGGFRPGPRPGGPTSFRPAGPRPGGFGGPGGSPGRDFGRGDAAPPDITSRGDKPNRKQFGPDAKPFRNRSQKSFRPEGGKKALKERGGGQLYSMDDEDDSIAGPEIDNFAEGLEDSEPQENQ